MLVSFILLHLTELEFYGSVEFDAVSASFKSVDEHNNEGSAS